MLRRLCCLLLCLVLVSCAQQTPPETPDIPDIPDSQETPEVPEATYLTENTLALPPEYAARMGILAVKPRPFVYVVRDDGTLWHGNYDSGIQAFDDTWRQITDITPRSIAVGDWAAHITDADGALWSYGSPMPYGLLGRTYIPDESDTFGQVVTDVRQSALGYDFAAVVKEDDTLWIWGTFGTILPENYKDPFPRQVMEDVLCISAVYEDLYILKRDGSLWEMMASANEDHTDIIHTPVQLMEGVTGLNGAVVRMEDGRCQTINSTPLNMDVALIGQKATFDRKGYLWFDNFFEDILIAEDCAFLVDNAYRTIYIDNENRLWYEMGNPENRTEIENDEIVFNNTFSLLDEDVVYAVTAINRIFYVKWDGTLWTSASDGTSDFTLVKFEKPQMILDHIMLPQT